MAGRYCYKDVIPFTAMVAIECTNVGVNVLFKLATQKGSRELPPLNVSLIFRIFLLGVIGVAAQLCGYKGLEYTSPTLASSLGNLVPAFTFILAIIFRMETINLSCKSSKAKILGSTVSILGALTIVLYKGSTIIPSSSTQPPPIIDSSIASTSQSNLVLGGSLLVIEYIFVPIWYIIQTNVIKEYPAEVIVVFLYNVSGALVSVPICLLLESNLSAWKINPDITLISILYSGFFCTGLSSLVHTWGLNVKGPVYISLFKPLSIAIAASFSAIFLGDALYFGTVVGAVILSIGFYGVIWGKAKEESNEEFEICRVSALSNSKTPLLQ
ncbi:WAT1-related protein At5g40240-like isoform X2 [Cicer arietinum]|uniref:WAT1-related protein n=1 Tax=Cicer arietinum TaxID=3827 RepID=A0A1S2Y5E4_CICAR|nr:WAT1-related protein At5g40240-like isoform X2 [Cicer arietinum]